MLASGVGLVRLAFWCGPVIVTGPSRPRDMKTRYSRLSFDFGVLSLVGYSLPFELRLAQRKYNNIAAYILTCFHTLVGLCIHVFFHMFVILSLAAVEISGRMLLCIYVLVCIHIYVFIDRYVFVDVYLQRTAV